MDDQELKRELTPSSVSEPSQELKDKEQELWQSLVAHLAEENKHREYVGFVLKNNMVKTATRRYGEIIDDKDRFPVEERRLARKYQKNLVDILFFSPKKNERRKSSSLEGFVIFLAVVFMLGGLSAYFMDTEKIAPAVVLILKLLLPLSAAFLGITFWMKFKKVKNLLNE